MLRGLVTADVEFVVIGGVAAVAHGSSYQTNDLDICYRDSSANIRRLSVLLRTWNAYPREWETGRPFDVDPRTIKTTPTLNLRTTEGFLDLLAGVAGLDGYETAVKHSEEVEALGVRFRVLTLPALIRAKETLGRPKDLSQVPALRALLALRQKT
jgi:predicted nucleotidyltransferase